MMYDPIPLSLYLSISSFGLCSLFRGPYNSFELRLGVKFAMDKNHRSLIVS